MAQSMRQDSTTMKTISVLGLVLLPGTFVSVGDLYSHRRTSLTNVGDIRHELFRLFVWFLANDVLDSFLGFLDLLVYNYPPNVAYGRSLVYVAPANLTRLVGVVESYLTWRWSSKVRDINYFWQRSLFCSLLYPKVSPSVWSGVMASSSHPSTTSRQLLLWYHSTKA